MRFPPSMLAHPLVVELSRSCFDEYVIELSWVQPPCFIEETQSLSRHPGPYPMFATIFLPIFHVSRIG